MVRRTIGCFFRLRLQNWKRNQCVIRRHGREMRTIASDPQQRAVLLPFSEFVAMNKPRSSSIMLSLARVVVIYGTLGRREPSLKFLLDLVPCECALAWTANNGTIEE